MAKPKDDRAAVRISQALHETYKEWAESTGRSLGPMIELILEEHARIYREGLQRGRKEGGQ